ncbi:MAG: ATP-binding protein, partial [Telluria sp.]
PLAPISAGAQMLQRSQPDVPVVARTTAIIVRQVAHMTRLIDDLLDVSRVTRGLVKLHSEAVDMGAVIADAVEQIEPLITKKRHTTALSIAPHLCHVDGDRKRLVQICGNLINNAAKYTPDGGHLAISLSCDGQTVTFTVADNGIGMPLELQTRVFDLFAQGERDADRSQGGLGLGLALVKMLVLLHGGTVQAYSAGLGLGSCFTVTLPRGAPAAIAAPAEAVLERAPVRRRCLVVDDNVDAAATLAMMLTSAGHEAVVSHTASEAIAMAGSQRPDVLLLDIGLPDLNGNELVGYLKRIAGIENSLYVAVTGYGRKEDRDASLAAGFDEYFVKPVEIDALLESIAQIATVPTRGQGVQLKKAH